MSNLILVHHMRGLSPKVSRYLSHFTGSKSHPILSHSADAQDQEHELRACAAGLPGIYNMDLVSHIKLRGVPKPEELALPQTGVPRAGA